MQVPVWADLAKFRHLGMKLNNFGHIENFGQTFEHTLVNLMYFGHILIVVNGQILNN